MCDMYKSVMISDSMTSKKIYVKDRWKPCP